MRIILFLWRERERVREGEEEVEGERESTTWSRILLGDKIVLRDCTAFIVIRRVSIIVRVPLEMVGS